jgi:hypothetical protein
MNTIEERIRAAARAAADTVPPDGVPPLELPDPVVPMRRRRGWAVLAGRGPAGGGLAGGGLAGRLAGGGQRARWVAPVAAAVAVVAVVVAASVIAGRGTAAGPAEGQGSTAGSTSVAELVKSGQIPPYYLDVTGTGVDNIVGQAYVVVRATATGKALDTIRPPVPGDGITGVTGAADDQTFILDEQPPAQRDSDIGREPHTFYEVRLDAAGQPGPVTKLPLSLPRNRLLDAFALSPDGSKLAMAAQPFTDGGKNPGSATVTVYTLATGQSHSWTGNGWVSFDPESLSWTSDGQTLAFQWNDNSTDATASGVYVLHLAQGGGNLEADSHEVVPFEGNGNRLGCIEAGVTITADGSALTCAGVRIINPNVAPDRQQTQAGFLEFSTATGKLLRVLGGWYGSDVPEVGVCWSNASGSLVIGTNNANAGRGRALRELGVQSAAGFTPLPGTLPQNGPVLLAW